MSRGKGGGVKLAKSLEEVRSISNDILECIWLHHKHQKRGN